ncbi:phosphatase PAP2 family protein [Candidatus Uhrbacteria bacterium]|nr:phosphatase PAP2 family protein [Candidatus Uhrbacteria bacterium]
MTTEAQFVSLIQQAVLESPFAVAAVVFGARWLIFAFAAIAAGFLLIPQKTYRHGAIEIGWSLLTALALTAFIAAFVLRGRPVQLPFDAAYPIRSLIPKPLTSAFPSGHTATAIAMACAVFFTNRKLGLIALLLAVLVAVSRIAAGVHYPTDVLGGIAVGVASFAFVRFGHEQLRTRDIERAARRNTHA